MNEHQRNLGGGGWFQTRPPSSVAPTTLRPSRTELKADATNATTPSQPGQPGAAVQASLKRAAFAWASVLSPRRARAQLQVPSRSASNSVTGHAPSLVFETTVWVTSDRGSCTERNETPASKPSRNTLSVDPLSQNPRP